MKKTIILILALLPIVLLIVISVAGRILSTYQHIEVARVVFTDDAGNELDANAVLTLGVGETKNTKIKIFPELAANKKVSYSSTDETVCTVDASGAVTGVRSGSAIIIVRTAEGNKTAKLNVVVRADSVTGVTVTPGSLKMMKGESRDLSVVVEPYAALNKNVTYETSDSLVVTVSKTGKLKAVGAGTAIITVTTVDGGFTATCEVTVIEETPPLQFDFENVDFTGVDFIGIGNITSEGTGYLITAPKGNDNPNPTINLKGVCLKVDEKTDRSEICIRVVSGSATVDENGVLTFTQRGIVNVEAFVGDPENPTYRVEIRIAWLE